VQYLDQGFATPVASESKVDALPPVVPNAATVPPPTTAPSSGAAHAGGLAASAITASKHGGLSLDSPPVAIATLLCGLVLLAVVRRAMLDAFERQRVTRLASDHVPDEW
jgi:hypothetical protein